METIAARTRFVDLVEDEHLTGVGSDDTGAGSASGTYDLYKSHNASFSQEPHTWINTLLSLL